MKRKLLAILLTLTMVLSLLPTAAFAVGAGDSTYTVGTGGEYVSISAAQDAASEAGVTQYTIQLASAITTTSTVTIATDTDVTLDLNGKTWTVSTTGTNKPIYIQGKLTVTDTSSESLGAIVNTATGVYNGAIFDLSDHYSYDSEAKKNVWDGNTATLVIDAGTFKCAEGSSANGTVNAPSNTHVEINGGVFYGTKYHVISAYGQLVITDGELHLTGNTLGTNVNTSAIYVTGAGNVQITGGSIDTNASGIYVAQSTSGEGVSVSGMTIQCNSATYPSSSSTNNTYGIYAADGTLALDDVTIEGEAYCGVLTVVETEITDSTITGSTYGINATGLTDGTKVSNVTLIDCEVTGGDAAVRVAGVNDISVTIDGGEYTADDDGSALLVSEAITNGTVTGTVLVKRGTFSSDVTDYIDKTANDVIVNADGTYTVTPAQASVASINGKEYKTLEEAIKDVQPGETIKLLANIDLADNTPVKITDKGTVDSPITLDLNGCTISGSNTNSSGVSSSAAKSGILTVYGSYVALTDTSDSDNKGGIINTNTASFSTSVVTVLPSSTNGSQLTVTGGVVLENQSSKSSKGIRVHTTSSSLNAAVTVENASIKCHGTVVDTATYSTAAAVIHDGIFEADENLEVSGNVTVNGGTFINGKLYNNLNYIAEGKVAVLKENDSGVYVVTVVDEETAEYTARLSGTCLCVDGDLYIFQDIKKLAGQTISVIKNASLTFPEGESFGTSYGVARQLTLELADDVTLSGNVPLTLADITVTGSGTVADNVFKPADDTVYRMQSNGENGLYSCRHIDPVAQITYTSGSVATYADADTAVGAINASGVQEFKLLKNISTAIQVNESYANVTIDLNGFTYTYTGTGAAFLPYSGKTLTITNGILECSSGSSGIAVQVGTPPPSSSTGNLVIESSATVKGTISMAMGTLDVYGTVDTSEFTTYSAIMGNGSANDGTTINIYDGAKVISAGTTVGIYHPQAGTLNISGGEITGGDGIYIKSGTLNITGGTITGNGAKAEYTYNGNGYNPTGDALVIDNCNYPGGELAANISGGDFKSTYADPVGSYAYGGDLSPLTGFITGGYYQPNIADGYVADGYGAVDSDKDGYTSMIGQEYTTTFTVTPSNATVKVTDSKGRAVTANPDGTYTLNSASSYTYTVSAPGYPDKSGSITAGGTADQTISVALGQTSGGDSGSSGSSSSGGSGSSGYTVSITRPSNGTVTASDRSPDRNDTVTLTVKPNAGYELDTLTVTDSKGNRVRLTDKGDGRYTFTMPASKVTVSATFAKIGEADGFADVPANAYYRDAVAWAVEDGITNGATSTTFDPDRPCTRAQTVTFLWRAAGCPEPVSKANPFTDVAADAYYYKAVLWAVENEITNGITATTFGPDRTVTRAQSIAFLWRASGRAAAVNGTPFTDVAADAYYVTAVAWAVENGVTNGATATTFGPNAPCTRAQIVTFLYRADA